MNEQDLQAGIRAFETLFEWVRDAEVPDALTEAGVPYRWKRGGFTATHMRTSPAGEFFQLQAPGFVAYRWPGKQGFGYQSALDLRVNTTLRQLLNEAAEVTGGSLPPRPAAPPGYYYQPPPSLPPWAPNPPASPLVKAPPTPPSLITAITRYVTPDGKEWETEAEAARHQARCDLAALIDRHAPYGELSADDVVDALLSDVDAVIRLLQTARAAEPRDRKNKENSG